ncbi:MAG: AAA family ATPase, partial [Polyangiaceae bacterium]
LAAYLDHLLTTERSAFDLIQSELKRLLDFVEEIQLPPWRVEARDIGIKDAPPITRLETIGREIHFRIGNQAAIPADLASSGVMLILGYLAIAYSPSQPDVLLIEEPENGIHPRALERVMRFFRMLASNTPGPEKPQVILTTHSPYLLDFVEPEQVIMFGRKPNGESVAANLATLPGVQERRADGMSVGELWYNAGEDELLKDRLK